MSVKVPKYRHHKHSGQAYVEINGRFHYLGKYDSPESHEEYKRKITAYLAQREPEPLEAPAICLSVDELVLRYFRFAKTYYVKNGKFTDEINIPADHL